jgi:hypothetical protein
MKSHPHLQKGYPKALLQVNRSEIFLLHLFLNPKLLLRRLSKSEIKI